MRELALEIRNNLDGLATEFEQRLRSVRGYAELPGMQRAEAARSALLVVAAGLESEEPDERRSTLFVKFVQAIARQRMAQGFEIDSVQQALAILAEILEPRLSTPEAVNLLWRTMAQAHSSLSQVAMAKLRTTQEQFRYLADNLAVGIFIHREGILRYAGREGARLLGYNSPEELLGRSVFDFVHPADRERVASIARHRVAGKPVPEQYTARLLKKDGSVIHAQIYSTLTEYEGQVATQGVFVDISERKMEEARIRQAQKSLQTLIDSMPFGVMITGTDKRIRHANQAALAAMGYDSVKQVAGLFCHETMCPAEADRCPILDLGQKLDRAERTLVTRDGLHVPILKSAVPVRLGGEELLLEAFVDITEQKRLEQQVQESLERRGRQVRTSTDIAQEIAASPALEELYQKVVALVKERFGYYHVQLFLLNEMEERLESVAGYGEVGAQLVRQGHFIPMGKGVVGRAGSRGQPVLSPDVMRDPEWLYQPLLPETKGELAVPIIIRRAQDLARGAARNAGDEEGGEHVTASGAKPLHGRLLGVLDVQSDRANLLSDDDRILLEGLSGQIAIAIESTRLRQETEEYLHELEYTTRVMSRQGWEAFRQKTGPIGYLFDKSPDAVRVVPAEDLWVAEVDAPAEQEGAAPLLPGGAAQELWAASGNLLARVPGVQSMAVAPLHVRSGESIGVLGVQEDPDNPLSPEERALVESVAEQVAQILESTRLFEETQRRLQELATLFEVSQALAIAPLQAEEMAALIARQFVKVMAVPEASVSLLGPDQDVLQVVADVFADPEEESRHKEQAQTSFRLSDYPASARVMETLQPLVVQASDPAADPAELAYMQQYGTATLAIIPVAVKGQAIGLVEFESRPEERRYTAEELRLAAMLANQVAVALENARLFAEAQMRAEEQAILNELARALAACQDVDSILNEAYRGVSRLLGGRSPQLGAPNLEVMLYEPETGQVTLALTVVNGQIGRPGTTQPIGELGLVRQLIATRQPLLLSDRGRERVAETPDVASPSLPSIPPGPGSVPASWLGVPMMIRDRVLGTMALSHTATRAFDEHSQYLLTAVANQAAIALENVRLLDNTRLALAEVQATHRSYLRQAWQEYLKQREMLRQSGFVYDQRQAEQGQDSATPGTVKQPLPAPDLWRPEMERAIADNRPAVAQAQDGDDERAGLAVPITVRGQTLGVIGVEAPAGDRRWTEDEIALVEAVGEQLGQALESARLFADTQRRAERERIVGEVTAKIRASTDMQSILETAAAELGRVLGTSRALVRLTTGEPGPGQEDRSAVPDVAHDGREDRIG